MIPQPVTRGLGLTNTAQVSQWANDDWTRGLRDLPRLKGATKWVDSRVGAGCPTPIPDVRLDETTLPPHLSWLGASASVNRDPGRGVFPSEVPKSEATLECLSIALGSVASSHRSQIPSWPHGQDPKLRARAGVFLERGSVRR